MNEIESIKQQIIKLAQAIEAISAGTKCYYYILDEIKQMQQQTKVKPASDEHECKYCGCITNKPDNDCYKNPNWGQETSGR